MTRAELLREVLALPPEEQERLLEDLLEQLPTPEPVDELDDELRAKIAQRARDITEHPERFRPAAEVMASVRAALAVMKTG